MASSKFAEYVQHKLTLERLATHKLTLITRIVITSGAAALTSLFLINLCAAIFQCGCTLLWAGAGAHCNVHVSNIRHCPWCAQGHVGYTFALWSIIAVQVIIGLWPGSLTRKVRLFAVIAALPVLGTLIAVVYGILRGYWS